MKKRNKYVGVHFVDSALPMTTKDYYEFEGTGVPVSNHPGDEGYATTYNNAHHAWIPKEVFESDYRKVDGLTFGLAIEALIKGYKVARRGWNGKGMYIYLQNGSVVKEARNNMVDEIIKKNGSASIAPHIDMKAANDEIIVGWLASQTDMLAEDWLIVEDLLG